MREIDFLPAWYPAIQRRYRWLIVQLWVTVAILILLTGQAMVTRWRSLLVSRAAAQAESQIQVSQQQLAHLAEKVTFERELKHQDQIVATLGIDVGTTRLLEAIEEAMTPDMSLTRFSLETLEQTGQSGSAGDVDRRLRVSADGIATADMEVATMMERMQKSGCFENVAFPYLREGRTRDGHLVREFEVTFEINLNPPSEGQR